MPFVEDLGQFLRTDEFASAAELRLAGGEVRELVGIFDEPFIDAELGGGQGDRNRARGFVLDATEPTFTGREADFEGAKRGDVLVIGARQFDVMSAPQVDGTGMASLRLAPQPGQGRR